MIDLDKLYQPNPGLASRSISFENPTGAPGAGGKAESPLGIGRKGDPARMVESGETVLLADISGPGTIRHIWMTTLARPVILRGALIRIYWEGESFPTVELPLGDFFGFAHGSTPSFQSALHAVGPRYGMNSFVPMPFQRQARIELVNETPRPMTLFYQVDYTIGDEHGAILPKLHGWFNRQNPTVAGQDFVLLHERVGTGRFLGSVIGIQPLGSAWWGEGEVKFYMDDDGEFATIVGTGSEDYVGLSWGIQQAPFLYLGANRVDNEEGIESGPVSMYRWHVQDPIFWQEKIRVTMQQIGHQGSSPTLDDYKRNLFEREDDWSSATFWYAEQLAPLPTCLTFEERVANLPKVKEIVGSE
jgi:hypothetical protein